MNQQQQDDNYDPYEEIERPPFKPQIEVFENNNAYAWWMLDNCGWNIAKSFGTYTDRAAAEADAQRFKDWVTNAPIVFVGNNPDVEL